MTIHVYGRNETLLGATTVARELSTFAPAITFEQGSSLEPGDTLLVLGLQQWSDGPTLSLLRDTRARGATCILWQLEPMLPPTMGSFARLIVQRDLQRHTRSQRPSDRRQVATDWLISQILALGPPRFEKLSTANGKMFRYPLRQARALTSLWRAGLIDQIWVSVAARQAFLAAHGVPSTVVPVGYVAEFGRPLSGVAKDIDVLFIGRPSPRRRLRLRALQQQLAAVGKSMQIVERDCHGEQRIALMNRTRIVLNLLNFPWEFPLIRLLMAFSCRALVVSEAATEAGPFVNNRHLILRPVEQLFEALVHYLDNEAERQRIVDDAYAHVMKFTMPSILAKAWETRELELRS